MKKLLLITAMLLLAAPAAAQAGGNPGGGGQPPGCQPSSDTPQKCECPKPEHRRHGDLRRLRPSVPARHGEVR